MAARLPAVVKHFANGRYTGSTAHYPCRCTGTHEHRKAKNYRHNGRHWNIKMIKNTVCFKINSAAVLLLFGTCFVAALGSL
jgi:hypothetical protein